MKGGGLLPSGAGALLAALAVACGGASADPGLEAWLRLRGSQYVSGALDEATPADDGGPAITSLRASAKLAQGTPSSAVGGEVTTGANAVLVGLRGDKGHWIVPVVTPDPVTEQPATFNAAASLSREAPAGAATLVARAVDLSGHIGAVATSALSVTETAVPMGGLVISLDWDTEADLDLRVVAPDTRGTPVEIWSKRRLSIAKTPPGEEKPDAAEVATAGALDFDSNAQCVIDGRLQENVIWKQMPPPGSYTVRVDAFSLCGEVAARWRARVFVNGTLLTAAQGQMTDFDTRGGHAAGAGLTVLAFQL